MLKTIKVKSQTLTLLIKSKALVLLLLFLSFFATQLLATQLAYNQFTNYSDDGYSRDDGWKNQLKVKGKKESHKTYSFSSYPNIPVTVTFKMKWRGGWENSGSYQDFFKVYLNGTELVNDTFSGDASSWKSYSLNSQIDSSGHLIIKFYANSTSSGEYIVIDDVKIVTVALPPDEVNIEKTVDNSSPSVGDIVSFSIQTTNIGTDKKIEMRDWMESGVNGVTPNAFKIISYSTDKPDVTCSIDSGGGTPFLYCVTTVDYTNNEAFTTTVQARILKSGNIDNRAYGYKYPWDTSVMDSSTVSLNASPPLTTDLSITSIDDAVDPVGTNEDITYTVAISNSGNKATGVELNTTITAGTLKTAPTGWSCSGTSTIACTRNSDLNDGDSENVIFVFTAPSSPQTVTFNANISSYQNDPNLSNNSASTTTTVVDIIENADDLCYEDSTSSGTMCFNMGICSGGIGCRNTYHLKNIGDSQLSSVTAVYNEDGLGGSFGSSCGVNPSGTCQTVNNVDMGLAGLFGTSTEFTLSNPIPVNDNSNSIWTENFMSGSCFDADNLYATYIKDGAIHRGKVNSCSATPPPDETIPTDDANATDAICGTFEDMFQTHGTCSGSSGGTISFGNAGSTLDGSNNVILDNNDNTLNTCLVTTPTWVKNQYETCGNEGDCNQTGTSGQNLNINYVNTPQTATVSTSPSSSSNDITLSGTATLSDTDYNDITTSWHTGTTTNFDITNRLKINTLKMTTDNTFNFISSSPYSLEIGTLGIENNGVRNTISTNANAKNIKINTFNLPSETSLNLEATQTIKMESFTVGRGSTINLKAPFININNFISSNNGSGDSIIEIYTDYLDISELTLGQTVTLKVSPYTPGKRVLFRVNTLEESSSSSILLSSGNYYINTDLTIPGTSDISAMRAIDGNQLINLYINSNLTLGNNPGINATGNNGNYEVSFPAVNFMIFINGDLTTGGGGTTLNATIYLEGDATFGDPTYIKGALSANTYIGVGQGQFTYDQSLDGAGWGACSNGYCADNNLSEGFHIIDPDGGDDKNSFEIFCHQDTSSLWHELIALPIKNDSNNFLFDNNVTSSNYYDTSANPRTPFHAIEVDINNITYSETLDNGAPKPHIPVVVSNDSEPYNITTGGNSYKVMSSGFSNINLIGTPFTMDWNNTAPLSGCDESLLRKALGQAVKYNTINTNNGTSNDGKSRCKISTMQLSLLDDYRYLTYNGDEVLQHSCKEMAAYVPNNLGILNDQDIAGHFNILTSEPYYPNNTIPTTNGTRDNGTDIGAMRRPLTVYCKYQTDLSYVWTFLTALDGKVTINKNDLVNKQDTCSNLGLYFYVPNNKETFNRVRKYLKNSKTGENGWENYTGTIEEKIKALHPGNVYYLSAFRDVKIWPYGPMGVYFPLNGNHKADGTSADWGDGSNTPKGYMSGSPMHNIKTLPNYNDSLGKKGWVSILGSQDLNKTDSWWISDIGAGEEIGKSTPNSNYSPQGFHPIQSADYVYYEPNGNYTANAWLNFLFDSEGWIFHTDDWNNNYPYYDYMCMSETNYETAHRYQLVPGFFNAIERAKNTPPTFSNTNISTQIVKKPILLDIILYDINSSTGDIDTTNLSDQNKSVGVFLSKVDENTTNPSIIKYLGSFSNFSANQGRIPIPQFNVSAAIKKSLVQFFYCNAANTTWTSCWNYNGNANAPTISPIGNESDRGQSDSYDDFAIRPKKFDINISGTFPHKAGKNYNITFKALDDSNDSSAGYNETVEDSFKIDINETNSSCSTGDFNQSLNTTWSFSDGNKTIISHYSEVGIVNIKINEINGSEFAVVDRDDNDTSDSLRLITPYDKNISFTPDHFEINATLTNGGQNYTYISNDLNMSVTLDINVTAETENNTTTKNYNSACYAQKTDYNISYTDLNITPAGALTRILYFETNTSTEGNNSINSDINLTNIPKSIFSTDNNGTGSIHIKINFDRNKNKVVNPFDLNITDINVSDANATFGTKALDKNATFYYGRVHAPDYIFDRNNSTATIYYEVYSDQNQTTRNSFDINGSESVDSIDWYVNTLHVSSDGNVSQYKPLSPTIISTTHDSYTNGKETITVTTTKIPYKDKIDMNSSSWLIYNPTDFMVEFDTNGSWAGQGIQGQTVDLNISKKQNRRLDW